MAAQRVAIGVVTGAYGADGRLRVRWLGDGPDALLDAEVVYVARDEDDRIPRRHGVADVALAGNGEVRMALAGLRDRADAEAYKGHRIELPAAQLAALPEGDHYWHELVGCRVESTDGADIGIVRSLWETGAHDVLVVERAGAGPGDEPALIPTAAEFLTEIDAANRRLVVRLIPGLLPEADDAADAVEESGREG